MHSDEDEFIYILEGDIRVKLENELIEAAPGSFVFIPRGTAHTWQNVSDAPARFFAGVIPAAIAFEEFFARYALLPAEERGTEAFAHLATERGRSKSSGRRWRSPSPANPQTAPKGPLTRDFLFRVDVHVRQVWSPLWSLRVQNADLQILTHFSSGSQLPLSRRC